VYKDSAGNPTIGYGHLIKDGEDFSKGGWPILSRPLRKGGQYRPRPRNLTPKIKVRDSHPCKLRKSLPERSRRDGAPSFVVALTTKPGPTRRVYIDFLLNRRMEIWFNACGFA
jgi:GH24 family phage-related lysozyme (muramidase)